MLINRFDKRRGGNMKKKFKKINILVIIFTLFISSLFTGFTVNQNIYSETIANIFNGTNYYEHIGGHDTLGVERSFFTTANMDSSDLMPYVFEGEVTGKYTLTSMIREIEAQGFKVVSGINGDLYDTTSGASRGISIHEGLIKTSGYQSEYAIAFDNAGKASLASVSIDYSVKGTMNVPTSSSAATTDPNASATDTTVYVPTPYNKTIGYVNIPHGGGKALHMYNRQYGATTKSNQNCVEVVIDTANAASAQPIVNGTITGTVLGGKSYTKATPIADNQIVLSAAMDSPYATELAMLAPGTTVEITAKNNGSANLNNAKEALGIYNLIYDNGNYTSTNADVHPRTCIGIKPDGSTIILAIDGRQSGWSAGMGLRDTAEYLVSLGCTTVANMDGGGSTMLASRLPGKEAKATVKNKPSGKSERAVTNGLFFVYKGNGSGKMENIHTYVNYPVAMPGADVQLSTFATDNKFEPAQLSGTPTFDVEGGKGSVNASGLFTAGSTAGIATITARVGELTTTTKIDIYDGITFNLNVSKIAVDPGKTSDINVKAFRGYVPVASKDNLFTFKCDENIGKIDENGLFTATTKTGQTGKITVSYKDKVAEVPVQVGTPLTDFEDTKNHWAKEYINKLAADGIVNGMGNNLFQPDGSLTRAQFLAMLAKTLSNVDVSKSPSAGFTDVPKTEWFYNYVNWGFENNIVKGMDATTFAPDQKISREQMAVMLVNFANSQSATLADKGVTAKFTDEALISSWSKDHVNKVVAAGIISGHPEGNFEPQGNATRAQAAKVVYSYINR